MVADLHISFMVGNGGKESVWLVGVHQILQSLMLYFDHLLKNSHLNSFMHKDVVLFTVHHITFSSLGAFSISLCALMNNSP